MCNTLVTESDVTSSMMGEMYRQLASAQLGGRLYKTGYRRTKASPKGGTDRNYKSEYCYNYRTYNECWLWQEHL